MDSGENSMIDLCEDDVDDDAELARAIAASLERKVEEKVEIEEDGDDSESDLMAAVLLSQQVWTNNFHRNGWI